MNRDVFRDERGFTAAGMAVALLVTVALVFSAGRAYRVATASADVQEVADAAALAAENVVAEYLIAVRLCDAVVLSLSLTGAAACGLGVAALLVPPLESVSAKLFEAGKALFEARDSFSQRASEGLRKLQEALPYLAAASAAAVGRANGGASGADYLVLGLLVPATGQAVDVPALGEAGDLQDAIGEESADLQREAAEAEEAAALANEAKERAFARDCGDSPAYCLYERADHLAGLPAGENPLYRSIDAWSFEVPLERARAYYASRLANEAPLAGTVSEQANSALRRVFYEYAAEEMEKGYVRESDDSFDAFFPHLPRNTDEMRRTRLFTQATFPVSTGEGGSVLHAWGGCPGAAGASGTASLSEAEGAGWETCAHCEFTASSLGKVAAASTSIDNGFEYHYEAIASAADDYEAARAQLDAQSTAVKERVNGIFDVLSDVVGAAGSQRIDAEPPGRAGAVALAVSLTPLDVGGMGESFVAGGSTLGTRAAVSAATLLEEPSEEGKNVLSSLLDGIAQEGGAATGALRGVLDCWSGMLKAYADGQEAVSGAVRSAADAVPLESASGLGSWASDALASCMDALGLQPADLDALKPALVNSGHVAAADDGSFGPRFLEVKRQALALSGSSTSLFSSVATDVEQSAFDALERAGEGIVVASIELPFGMGEVPVTVALPPAAVDAAGGLVGSVVDGVRSAVASLTGVRPWE